MVIFRNRLLLLFDLLGKFHCLVTWFRHELIDDVQCLLGDGTKVYVLHTIDAIFSKGRYQGDLGDVLFPDTDNLVLVNDVEGGLAVVEEALTDGLHVVDGDVSLGEVFLVKDDGV